MNQRRANSYFCGTQVIATKRPQPSQQSQIYDRPMTEQELNIHKNAVNFDKNGQSVQFRMNVQMTSPRRPSFKPSGQMQTKSVQDEDETLEMPTVRDKGDIQTMQRQQQCGLTKSAKDQIFENYYKKGPQKGLQFPTQQPLVASQNQKSPAVPPRELKSRNQLQLQTATLVPPPDMSPTNQQRLFDNFKEARKTLIKREKPANFIPKRACTNLEMTPQMDSFSFTKDQIEQSPLRPTTVLKGFQNEMKPQKQLLLSVNQDDSRAFQGVRNGELAKKSGKIQQKIQNTRPVSAVDEMCDQRATQNRTPLLASASFERLSQNQNLSEQHFTQQLSLQQESLTRFNPKYRASSALQKYQMQGSNLIHDPKTGHQQYHESNKQCSLVETSMPNENLPKQQNQPVFQANQQMPHSLSQSQKSDFSDNKGQNLLKNQQSPNSSQSSGLVYLREVLTQIHAKSPFQSNAFLEVPQNRTNSEKTSNFSKNNQMKQETLNKQVDFEQNKTKEAKVQRGEIVSEFPKNGVVINSDFNGELFKTFQSENVTETVDYEQFKQQKELDSRHQLLQNDGFGEIAQRHHKRRLLLQIDELEYELDHAEEDQNDLDLNQKRRPGMVGNLGEFENNLVKDSSPSVKAPTEFLTQSTVQVQANQSRIQVESSESPLQVSLQDTFQREKSDEKGSKQHVGDEEVKNDTITMDKKVEMQKEVGLVCETQSSFCPAFTDHHQVKSERQSNVYSIGRVSIGMRRETSFDTIDNLRQNLFLSGKKGQQRSELEKSDINSSQIQSQGQILNEQERLLVDLQLDQINSKLNEFTLDKFEKLRQNVGKQGFYRKSVIKENSFNFDNEKVEEESGLDLLSELMITEDHRLVSLKQSQIIQQVSDDLGASKRIHIHEKKSTQKQTESFAFSGRNLARQIQIYQEKDDSQKELIHTVMCTGFTCSAPLLQIEISQNSERGFGILDRDFESKSEQRGSGPIFLSLLTDSILYSFSLARVKQFSCGFEHCVAVTEQGNVVSWGYGASGCLGHANFTSYTQPKLVTSGGLNLKKVTSVQSGAYHVAALTDDGHLYAWGRADVGQLGHPVEFLEKDSVGLVLTYPMHLAFFQKQQTKIVQVSLGEAHSVVLCDKGQVFSFGWNEFGQLGIDQTNSVHGINQVHFFDNEHNQVKIQQLACGSISTYAISDKKELYAWGCHQNGQIGIGVLSGGNQERVQCVNRPRIVEDLRNYKVIGLICGDSTTFVDTEEGKVFAWGKATLINKNDSIGSEVCRKSVLEIQSVETLHKFLVQPPNASYKTAEENSSEKDESIKVNETVEKMSSRSSQETNDQLQNIDVPNLSNTSQRDGVQELQVELEQQQPRESTAEFQSHMRKIRKSIMEVQNDHVLSSNNNDFERSIEEQKTDKVAIPKDIQQLDLSLSDLDALLDQPSNQKSPTSIEDSPEGTVKFNQTRENCVQRAKKSTISRLQQESESFLASIISMSSPDLASTQQRNRNNQHTDDMANQTNIEAENLQIINPAQINLSKFQFQNREKKQKKVRQFRLSKDLDESSFQSSSHRQRVDSNYNSVDVSKIGDSQQAGEIKNQIHKNLKTVKQISLVNSGFVKKDQRQMTKNSPEIQATSINSFCLNVPSAQKSNVSNQLSTNSTQIPLQQRSHLQELRSVSQYDQYNQTKKQKCVNKRQQNDQKSQDQNCRVASPKKSPSAYISASQINRKQTVSNSQVKHQDMGPLTVSQLQSASSQNTSEPKRNVQKNKRPVVTVNLQIRSPKVKTQKTRDPNLKLELS